MNACVSVVVPTCRRGLLLWRCLSALITQSCDRERVEVIVVDDGRSRGTYLVVEEIARMAGGAPAVRYLRPPPGARGPAAARNAGWRAARHPIIAFTDDDTVPAADWIAQGAAALTSGVIAAWGRIEVPLPPDPTDWARTTSRLEQATFVTANCFVRRDALFQVGGFDERFTRAWREDSDLYFALLGLPGEVRYAPGAVVQHPVRPVRWGASLGHQRNNFFDALLYKKHPARYREQIAAGPPLWQYATVLAFALAMVLTLGGWPGPGVLFAVVWAGLMLRFLALRLHGTSRRPAHVIEMVVTSAVIPFLAVYWRLRGALRFRVWFT